MIKLKIDEDKLKEITGVKCFDPIRALFVINDHKFNILISDKKFNIGPLFLLNILFPNGLISAVGQIELRKTCLLLDEIIITYSLIVQNSNNEHLNNILEDIRITIQNFLFSLNLKSYYVAFTELRKIIEGVLWIQVLKNDINELNNSQINDYDKNTYNKLIAEHAPELKNLWNMLSKLIHMKKSIISFNTNIYYQEPDNIYIFVLELQKTSEIIYNKLNEVLNFFKESNHKVINRYEKMIEKFHQEEGFLNCLDQAAKNDFVFRHDDETQKELVKIFNTNNELRVFATNVDLKENKTKLIILYRVGLINIKNIVIHDINHNNISENINDINNSLRIMISILPKKEEFKLNHFSKIYYDTKIINEFVHNNSLEKSYETYFDIFEMLFEICTSLFEKELVFKGNLNIAILRSLIEDLIHSFVIKKYECYPFFSYIAEFVEKVFDYKIIGIQKFVKYRHIQKDGRILYHNFNENTVSGEVNNSNEIFEIFITALSEITILLCGK